METEKLHQIGKDQWLTGVELAQFIKEGIQYEWEKEAAAREERAWKQKEMDGEEKRGNFETAKIEAELKKEELKIR